MTVRYGPVVESITWPGTCPACGGPADWITMLVEVIDDELGGADMSPRTVTGTRCPTCPTPPEGDTTP